MAGFTEGELLEKISNLENRVKKLEVKAEIEQRLKLLEEAKKAEPEPCYFCKAEQAKPIFKFATKFIFLCESCNEKRHQIHDFKPINF